MQQIVSNVIVFALLIIQLHTIAIDAGEKIQQTFSPQNDAKQEHKQKKGNLQNESNNRKAYVTLITADREVEKSLVMLASLFAVTKTRDSWIPKDGDARKYSSSSDIDLGQCHFDGQFNVQCDSHYHYHDYICLIIPKENNINFEHDKFLKKFKLGVSHSNVQKLLWAGCDVKPIPYSLYNPNYDVNDKEQIPEGNMAEEVWSYVNYNQIWLWSLKPHYDTVIYISAEHLILSNINHLFDRVGEKDDAPEPFIAAPHDHMIPNHFHSGFMIIEPDISTFQEMLNFVKEGDVGTAFSNNEDNEKMAHRYSIQEFLNIKMFPKWYLMSAKHRLEPVYNAPFEWTFDEYIWLSQRNNVKVFYFTPYNQPGEIIRNSEKYQISMYAAPIIYLWTLIMFFVTSPLVNLEEETRYALHEVFGINDNSENVIAYIERMKRGGTRRRLGLQ